MKMCCWAENIDAPKLFPSLMAVADPESWDLPDGFRKLWIFKKKGFGRYRLFQEIKKSAWSVRPRFRHLLAVAMCAKHLGYINWLRINDIVKPQLYQQVYDQDAVPILALLIALGLVEPEDHWQKRHQVGRGVDSFVSQLSHELHRKGRIRWKEGVGTEILGRLEHACHSEDIGVGPGPKPGSPAELPGGVRKCARKRTLNAKRRQKKNRRRKRQLKKLSCSCGCRSGLPDFAR